MSIDWPEGSEELKRFRARGVPTLIDVPFSSGREAEGREAVEAFEHADPYLPLFSNAIRCIEIECNGKPENHRLAHDVHLPGVTGVRRVQVDGSSAFAAMLFDLGEGYVLVAKLGPTGLMRFPQTVPRLWHMAPLDERLSSGWLLNGPFRLTPIRAELHYKQGKENHLFERLGQRLRSHKISTLHRQGGHLRD